MGAVRTMQMIHVLPQRKYVFLALGALCPIVTWLVIRLWVGAPVFAEKFELLLPWHTIPACIIGAYILGAIGMGYGFGRWRFA